MIGGMHRLEAKAEEELLSRYDLIVQPDQPHPLPKLVLSAHHIRAAGDLSPAGLSDQRLAFSDTK